MFGNLGGNPVLGGMSLGSPQMLGPGLGMPMMPALSSAVPSSGSSGGSTSGQGVLITYNPNVPDRLEELKRQNVEVKIDAAPFGKGGVREAFKLRLPSLTGNRVLVGKKYAWKDQGKFTDHYLEDYICYYMATTFAERFNQRGPPQPIEYTPFHKVLKFGGISYAIEDYLEGAFEKHNNIFGWMESSRQTPQAFSHFTHMASEGQLVVLDVQGARGPDGGYKFTDPACVSLDGRFGYTDPGVKSILEFFSKHECNEVCRMLKLPPVSMDQIRNVIPTARSLIHANRLSIVHQASCTLDEHANLKPAHSSSRGHIATTGIVKSSSDGAVAVKHDAKAEERQAKAHAHLHKHSQREPAHASPLREYSSYDITASERNLEQAVETGAISKEDAKARIERQRTERARLHQPSVVSPKCTADLVPPPLRKIVTDREYERVYRFSYDYLTKRWSAAVVLLMIEEIPFATTDTSKLFRVTDLSLPPPNNNLVGRLKTNLSPSSQQDLFQIVEAQALCRYLASEFNRLGVPKSVEFGDVVLIERLERNPSTVMLLEPYMDGKLDTHSATTLGRTQKDERNTPQAFSHFTCVTTQGRLLCANLKGVNDKYIGATIHTNDGKGYGPSNQGMAGMDAFFKSHRCNSICRGLRLPPRERDDGSIERSEAYAGPAVVDYNFEPTERDLRWYGLSREHFQKIISAFRAHDTEKESPPYIHKKKLTAVLRQLDVEVPTDQLASLFQALDRLGTGTITLGAFFRWWTGHED